MNRNELFVLHKFFSDGAWIEGAALAQLDQLVAMEGVTAVAALPDLHPGKYGPVGTATMSTSILPLLIGSDIGCGMGLYKLDIKVRKFKADKVAERLKVLDEPWTGDRLAGRLAFEIEPCAFDESLGSIGGGNHFCEMQAIQEIVDTDAASAAGLDKETVYCLVHTGSRGLGYSVLADLFASGQTVLTEGSEHAVSYMAKHDHAVAWAMWNRAEVVNRAADAAQAHCQLIADLSHNHITRVEKGFLHRKGAAPSDCGLVPIPGSRETLSYLVKPNPDFPATALLSLAHGAGRKYDRASMHGRIEKTKSQRESMARNPFGGIIVCEDRQLIIEESGRAYKDIDRVIEDIVAFNLGTIVASFRPLVTFKTGLAHIGTKGDLR